MSKKWMLVVGGVAVAAALIFGGLLLLNRGSHRAATSVSLSQDAQASSGATGSTTPGGNSEESRRSLATTPAINGDRRASSSLGKDAGDQRSTSTGKLKAFPAMKGIVTNTAPQTLTTPVGPGAALARLAGAPGVTTSALKVGALTDGTAYNIRMRPFGQGPDSTYGTRVVIRVDNATPRSGSPVYARLVNSNVLAIVDTDHGGTVTKGGTYVAVLTFRADGLKLLPILSGVLAATR
jgi:hypothetical protein